MHVIATNSVWLEGQALKQLEAVGADADCVAAVGMPDLHSGPGTPIGAAFAFRRTIRPALIGSDAGCGACLVVTELMKVKSTLERRIRSAFAQDLDPAEIDEAMEFWQLDPLEERRFLGTIGGGNHFAEISRVTEVCHPALGLSRGRVVVLVHSGSRRIGKELADTWGQQCVTASEAERYLEGLDHAVRFAQVNRLVIAWRLLRALGAAKLAKIARRIDVVHNTISQEEVNGSKVWIHRKGCAPAYEGEPTIVLGTRGTPSWLMLGNGTESSLRSVAHGAGRKLNRAEAREKLKLKYRRAALKQHKSGSRILCDDRALLYEEHPDAYKSIESIIDSLEQAGAAERIASLSPVFTVKH